MDDFFTALSTGDVDTVSALLEAGANVNAVDKFGNTALCCAIRNGNTAVVRTILENSPDLTVEKDNRLEVILSGFHAFVKFLLRTACDTMADWLVFGLGALPQEFAWRFILVPVARHSVAAAMSVSIQALEHVETISGLQIAVFVFLRVSMDLSRILVFQVHGASSIVWPLKLSLPATIKFLFFLAVAYSVAIILSLIIDITSFVIWAMFQIFVVQRVFPRNLVQKCPNDIQRPGEAALNALLDYRGHSEDILLALLNAGLNVGDMNKPAGYGRRVWIWAAARGYLCVARRLLRQGMVIDPNDPALLHAARGGHLEMVQFLIAKNVKVNPMDSAAMETPLLCAASGLLEREAYSRSFSVLSFLLDSGAAINARDAEGRTALSFAVSPWAKEAMMFLISAGADPLISDNHGKTPLHYAACKYNHEGVDLLLQAGTDPNVADEDGRIPLHHIAKASVYGADIKTRLTMASLIGGGSDINTLDVKGIAALTLVAWCGSSPMVMSFLITAGANINIGGGPFSSPLIAAARYGTPDMIEMLIQAGADVNFQSGVMYHSALCAALHHPNPLDGNILILLKYGADVSLEYRKGKEEFDCITKPALSCLRQLKLAQALKILKIPRRVRPVAS